MTISVFDVGTQFADTNNTTGFDVDVAVPGGGIPAGALIFVVSYNSNSNNTTPTVSDSASNTYTTPINIANGGASRGSMIISYAYNVSALTSGQHVRCHYVTGSNASHVAMAVGYATGILTSTDPYDSSFANTGSSASTNSFTINSNGAPVKANSLVVAAISVFQQQSFSGDGTYTTPPFTTSQSGGSPPTATAEGGYKISSSSESYSGSMSQLKSIAMAIVAFAPDILPISGKALAGGRAATPITIPAYDFPIEGKTRAGGRAKALDVLVTDMHGRALAGGRAMGMASPITPIRGRALAGGRAAAPITIPGYSQALSGKALAGGRASGYSFPPPIFLSGRTRGGGRAAGVVSGTSVLPVFPTLPVGFPVVVKPTFATVSGSTPAGREMRAPQQGIPVWEFQLDFETLKDQTQNQQPYTYFANLIQLTELVQLFITNIGQYGRFLFNAWWDNSRLDQEIASGDGVATDFFMVRTWGYGDLQFTEPVGAVNVVTNVKIDGVSQPSTSYRIDNLNHLVFTTPPPNNSVITSTFSFYYLCQWAEDQQDYSQFLYNRWATKVQFRSIEPETPIGVGFFPQTALGPPAATCHGPSDIAGGIVTFYSTSRAMGSGACTLPRIIRLRRASDGTELDIGTIDGNLDTAAATAFCSGTTCTISKIYNQGSDAGILPGVSDWTQTFPGQPDYTTNNTRPGLHITQTGSTQIGLGGQAVIRPNPITVGYVMNLLGLAGGSKILYSGAFSREMSYGFGGGQFSQYSGQTLGPGFLSLGTGIYANVSVVNGGASATYVNGDGGVLGDAGSNGMAPTWVLNPGGPGSFPWSSPGFDFFELVVWPYALSAGQIASWTADALGYYQ